MHDYDKALRAALMTVHRYARGGYAEQGFVDDAPDSVLMQERQPITPSSLAKAWTPPEETIAQNVGPRAGEFMQQYPEKLGAAMAAAPETIAHHVANTVMYPGQVLYGERPYNRDEAIKWANDAAGMIMTGGLGTAALTPSATKNMSSTTRIFAGPMAETADLAALDTAKKMAAANAQPSAIIKETGWFQGADGKWRFEIPDVKSKITDEVFNNIKEKGIHEGTLPAALEHPELYAAYPQLNEMQATFGASAKPRGSYSPWTKDITVEGPSVASQRSTALHEAQHAVQQIEGFARGADNIFLKPNTPAWDIYQERLKAIRTPMTIEEFEKAGIGSPEYTYSEYLKQMKDSIKNNAPMLDRAAQDYAVQEAYRRSAGETEARNVQARRNMEPSELQSKEPWTTQSIPTKEQIVQFHNTEPQMSVGPAEDAIGKIQNIKVGKSTGVYREQPDHFEISSIRTPVAHRGQGGAHAVIKDILKMADDAEKPTRLIASPLDKKTSSDKLINFYRKYGFELTGEKANSFGDPWMERLAVHKTRGGFTQFGPEAAQRAVRIAKQQAGRR